MEKTPQISEDKCYYTLGKRERAELQKLKPEGEGGFHVDTRWAKEDDTEDRLKFLKNLKLSPFTALEKLEGRVPCPKCKKSCKFYCWNCIESMVETPNLKLPIKVTVISHPMEKKSKSSILPAKLVAPDDVQVLSLTEVPAFEEAEDEIVLLFPGDHAK